MIRLHKILLILSVLTVVSGWSSASALDIVMLGDSNTWIGGDDCSNPRGWNYWLAQKDSTLNCRSYARSGATWTNTANTEGGSEEYTEVISDNNVIYNQASRLINDCWFDEVYPKPNVIIIMAGTNDAWFQERRPGIFSMTVEEAKKYEPEGFSYIFCPEEQTSLAGSVRLSLDLLYRMFEDTRLVVLTPIQSTATSLERQQKVNDIIEGVTTAFDIECLRLDSLVPIHADEERVQHRYTTDGTHTSEEGARLIADIVYSKLFSK